MATNDSNIGSYTGFTPEQQEAITAMQSNDRNMPVGDITGTQQRFEPTGGPLVRKGGKVIGAADTVPPCVHGKRPNDYTCCCAACMGVNGEPPACPGCRVGWEAVNG